MAVQDSPLSRWKAFLADCGERVEGSVPFATSGQLTRINGLIMEATGLRLPLGANCLIQAGNTPAIKAEVVGFHGERLFLMPTDDIYGLSPGARVIPVFVDFRHHVTGNRKRAANLR